MNCFPRSGYRCNSMVTFHDHTRYSHAYRTGQLQKKIMDEVMQTPEIETKWMSLDFASIVSKLNLDSGF
jgi:hypothetical protein